MKCGRGQGARGNPIGRRGEPTREPQATKGERQAVEAGQGRAQGKAGGRRVAGLRSPQFLGCLNKIQSRPAIANCPN